MSQEKHEQIEYEKKALDDGIIWDRDKQSYHHLNEHIIKYNGKNEHANNLQSRIAFYSDNNQLGQGGFGAAYSAKVYTVNYELKKLTYKKEKIVKVMHVTNADDRGLIFKEYQFGKKAAHLGMKAPVFEGILGNETCYLVMNRIPGQTLFNLIARGDIGRLSVDLKLLLTYKLLLALREQVVRYGIVHRDIKPENIVIELEPEIRVGIIDYGVAKEAGTEDGCMGGTLNYAAPEVLFEQPHDVACDVYSMAKTILTLWTHDDTLYNKPTDFASAQSTSKIFAESLHLYLDEPIALVVLLKKMVHFMQNERINIHGAIAEFERIFIKGHCSWDDYQAWGDLYFRQFKYDKAIICYSNAIQLNPNSAILYNNLACIYFSKGSDEAAVRYFIQAIQLDTTNKDAHCNLGYTYRRLGLFTEALNSYCELIKLDLNYQLLSSKEVLLTIKELHRDEQIKLLQQCLDPETTLGKFYEKQKNTDIHGILNEISSQLHQLKIMQRNKNLFFRVNDEPKCTGDVKQENEAKLYRAQSSPM